MAKAKAPRRIALALQGGGSHGAFTWGVLDRLLEDETLEVIGITGTSAGAMNAVVMADGLVRGGRQEARLRLRQFWEEIGRMPGFAGLFGLLPGEFQAQMRLEQTPTYLAFDALSRNLSPYDLNPFNFNPLRDPLIKLVDFDRLRAQEDLELMVCATDVFTSRRRVFGRNEISVESVLASACLPQMFPAIEVDGQPYWDGGFSGNPAMAPLLRKLPKCDFIIVRIDPMIRVTLPRTPHEIQDRVTELSFNTTFWMEVGGLAVILKLMDAGLLDRERFGRILFHMIEASSELEKIAASTKRNNSEPFLRYLFGLGRNTAEEWFARHGEAIGDRTTFDFKKLLPDEHWGDLSTFPS